MPCCFHCRTSPLILLVLLFAINIPRVMFEEVDVLSEDEANLPASNLTEGKTRTGKRRLRKIDRKPKVSEKPDLLLKKISGKCSCRKGTCCSQFAEEERWAAYSDYVRQWNELNKLDQDRIVTCSFIARHFCFDIEVICLQHVTCFMNQKHQETDLSASNRVTFVFQGPGGLRFETQVGKPSWLKLDWG